MNKLKEYFFIVLVCMTSFSLTVFVILNSWEVTSNIDLPIIDSVKQLELQDPINSIIQFSEDSNNRKVFSTDTPSIGDLDYLQISSTGDRVFIGRERFIDGKWSYRPNNIHYHILNYDDKGLEGDYLMYTSKSWRTIPEPELVQVGDTITIFGVNGRSYDFVIFEKKVLRYDDLIVPEASDRRQITILVEDSQNDVYYTFLAR